jgi:hypothetical protein
MLFKRLTMKEANSNYIFPTELHISLEDIEQILGMKFEFFIDDLGETYDALIETNNGVRIAFVCRKGHNYKYIIVGVQEYFFRTNKDYRTLLENELLLLGIPIDKLDYYIGF